MPFEIPESWEWVRISEVVIKDIKRGKSPKYTEISNIQVFAQKCNVKTGGIDMSLAKFLDVTAFEKYPIEEYMQDKDIIINSTGNGTLGRIGIFHDTDRIGDYVIVPDSHVTIIRASSVVYLDYVYYVLKYYQPFLERLGEGSTNQTELKPAVISKLFFPLPPLREQKRIADKLLSIKSYIDKYNHKESILSNLNKDFPEMLRKSILQEAVMGKLVPQDEDDEPASVLLERIREEKQHLIAEGKLKKDKHESIIYRRHNSHYEKLDGVERCIDDEIPFEIPDSWEWIRLGTLFEHNTGKTLNQTKKEGILLDYITTSNLYWNRFKLESVKQMYFKESEIIKCTATKGDLLVCEGGDIGRAAIWNYDYDICIQNHIHKLRAYVEVSTEFYFYLFFLYKTAGWIGGKGIGIQGLSTNALHNILFPLPPTAEQFRIAKKIKILMKSLDSL